jgi:hypothetical protein
VRDPGKVRETICSQIEEALVFDDSQDELSLLQLPRVKADNLSAVGVIEKPDLVP